MKVLIVEDEAGARDDLRGILSEIAPDIEVAGTTESVTQTVAWLERHQAPDLIFMDIHLSDASAFEIFRRTDVGSPVVFTTAYDEYAIHAFRVNAIDYLLKPVDIGEMRRALAKYRDICRPPLARDLNRLVQMFAQQQPTSVRKSILIAYQDKLLPIPAEKIAFFYSTKETSKVYLADGTGYAYNRTLESICEEMDARLFCRVNKQFVVAKEHIRNIVVWSKSRLRITMNVPTPEPVFLSKNRAAAFKKWLTE